MMMTTMMASMPAVATSGKEDEVEERKKQGQFMNHMVDPCVCHI